MLLTAYSMLGFDCDDRTQSERFYGALKDRDRQKQKQQRQIPPALVLLLLLLLPPDPVVVVVAAAAAAAVVEITTVATVAVFLGFFIVFYTFGLSCPTGQPDQAHFWPRVFGSFLVRLYNSIIVVVPRLVRCLAR